MLLSSNLILPSTGRYNYTQWEVNNDYAIGDWPDHSPMGSFALTDSWGQAQFQQIVLSKG